jgi:hypothetical protein
VKRREVVQIMESLEEESESPAACGSVQEAAMPILVLADGHRGERRNRPRSEVSMIRDLSDLGFRQFDVCRAGDAIENAGGSISAPERFNEVQDVRELLTSSVAGPGRGADETGARDGGARKTTRFTFLRLSHGGQQGRRLPAAFLLRSVSAHALRRPLKHSAAHELHRRRQSLFAPRHGSDEDGAR